MQNSWNVQHLGNHIRSDYDTCILNLCNKLRYRGIETMHVGIELLYDHSGITHWYLTQRFPSSTMNDSGQSSIGKVRQNHAAFRMNITFGEVLREVLTGFLITESNMKRSRIRGRCPGKKRVLRRVSRICREAIETNSRYLDGSKM